MEQDCWQKKSVLTRNRIERLDEKVVCTLTKHTISSEKLKCANAMKSDAIRVNGILAERQRQSEREREKEIMR